jgi:hypothetical protein
MRSMIDGLLVTYAGVACTRTCFECTSGVEAADEGRQGWTMSSFLIADMAICIAHPSRHDLIRKSMLHASAATSRWVLQMNLLVSYVPVPASLSECNDRKCFGNEIRSLIIQVCMRRMSENCRQI